MTQARTADFHGNTLRPVYSLLKSGVQTWSRRKAIEEGKPLPSGSLLRMLSMMASSPQDQVSG